MRSFAREERALDEEVEVIWREFLTYFNDEIYPMFAEHGFSKNAALLTWMLGRTQDAIGELNADIKVLLGEGEDFS